MYVCVCIYIYTCDTGLHIVLICIQHCIKTSMNAVVQQYDDDDDDDDNNNNNNIHY